MSKGIFGAGIIGFILGLLTFGLYTGYKSKQEQKRLAGKKAADDSMHRCGPKQLPIPKY